MCDEQWAILKQKSKFLYKCTSCIYTIMKHWQVFEIFSISGWYTQYIFTVHDVLVSWCVQVLLIMKIMGPFFSFPIIFVVGRSGPCRIPRCICIKTVTSCWTFRWLQGWRELRTEPLGTVQRKEADRMPENTCYMKSREQAIRVPPPPPSEQKQ